MSDNSSTVIEWGHSDPHVRGPIIVNGSSRWPATAIGAHGGANSIYAALGQTIGALDRSHMPDLAYTIPRLGTFPPNDNALDMRKIVTLDPWGHLVANTFARERAEGANIRPTIAITPAYMAMPEMQWAIKEGHLKPDNKILDANGRAKVTKIAIEAVWHLPGLAQRLGINEGDLREGLVTGTNGMYRDLVTRPDIHVFVPPIGGTSIYIFGDLKKLADPDTNIAARVHDECNGSDTFGASICTCRPYLAHGVNVCIENAINGGVGIIVYNRKEGRGLGEVIKLLVYNSRFNQPGGDTKENYFPRTQAVAGVEDLRFQSLMPDALHWLGVRKIDQLLSMSPDKLNAIRQAGIRVAGRVGLPDHFVPPGAQIEFGAKQRRGYRADPPSCEP